MSYKKGVTQHKLDWSTLPLLKSVATEEYRGMSARDFAERVVIKSLKETRRVQRTSKTQKNVKRTVIDRTPS